MNLMRRFIQIFTLVLMLVPASVLSQEQPAAPSKPATVAQGVVDFGARRVWGDEYGRPDLPFKPDVRTSKFNEYSDYKNGFVIPKARLLFDNFLGTKNYLSLQSQSTLYGNQSYLATFGQYGRFKAQFRYDEIPHIYTNTSRTFYSQSSPGVFTISPAIKQALQDHSSIICATPPCTAAQIAISLPGYINSTIVPGLNFYLPEIKRKAATASASWDVSENWNINALYSREHEIGTRPIGELFYTSPSAGASTMTTSNGSTVAGLQSPGTGAEVPEAIDYHTTTVKVMTEYGKNDWGLQVGYTGSFFRNNIDAMFFDNPFATADVAVQLIPKNTGGCKTSGTIPNCIIGAVPARGEVDLYPSNHANYLNVAGAFNAGKHLRIMGSVNPEWRGQNDKFLPYTSNSQVFFPDSTGALTVPGTSLSLLPQSSLNGVRHILAMNYTAVYTPVKSVEVKAAFRQYDFKNPTAVLELTPILGDTIAGNSAATGQLVPGAASSGSGAAEDTAGRSNIGFDKKNLELTGEWYLTKRNSLKIGWESEWYDRTHRDVSHSLENSFFGAADLSPNKDLLVRLSARHQNRKPEVYEDELFDGVECDATSLATARTNGVFPDDQPCSRRFDEAARILNRADVLVDYTVGNFDFSGSYSTIQADYNRPGGTNSATALNFLTGSAATTKPYYLYGALNDLSYVYTFDVNYTFTPDISFFAEYTYERYHKKMVSRNRSPFAATAPFCSAGGCDSANNDWESTYRDLFDTYAAGFDFYVGKKAYFTPYYSLSAGKGNIGSRYLGDPTLLTAGNPDKFILLGSSAAVPYPETTTRIHEVGIVFKYKLTENILPKIEYRYQQFDNRDYQTSVMTPYMGCVSPAGATAATTVIGCPAAQLIGTTSTNPTFTPSPYYPGYVVGDTSSARYIFLGADQPSYRVHVITASVEYHF